MLSNKEASEVVPDRSKEDSFLEHIHKLINDAEIPDLDEILAGNPAMGKIHSQLAEIRSVLTAFSRGDLSPLISTRGYIAGCIKALQAHLRHMVWQVKQVEQGDFSQRVEFLGDFSDAFNNMIDQLDNTLKSLQKKEETLKTMTHYLRNEMDLRNSALEALQESEARFKYLASHDPLTGAFNRRSFMDRALIEFKAAFDFDLSCCFGMLDIDHFKQFNDTYGHVAGDKALQHMVKTVVPLLRKGDFMGRYGGEEFIFFFYNAGIEAGCAIAERIREAVEASPVEIETGKVHVTVSIGISVGSPGKRAGDMDYIQDIVSLADMALYKAKGNGRNRVEYHS